MASVGINRRTGKVLTGWQHVRQSIEDIITTPKLMRVMVRQYGSDQPRLIDVNMSERALLALYVAIATALVQWEPRFELTYVGFEEVSPGGHVKLALIGTYFENGHLGDRSIGLDKQWELTL